MHAAITPGPRPAPRRGNQYWTIQALRFLAAFAVVGIHSSLYTHERLDPLLPVYDHGANGVRLFFVISGFVMIMSSQKLMTAARGWSVFAVKRVLRIVPLYWAITALKLVVLLVTPAGVLHAKVDWIYIAKSFAFIPASNVDGSIAPLLGVGWTLNFEMFFYALFAIALLLRVRPVLFIAPVLLVLSALSLVRAPDWPTPLHFWSDPIVLDFLAGMLIARWCQQERALPVSLSWIGIVAGLIWLFAPMKIPMPFLASSLLTTAAASLVVIGAASLEPRIGQRMPRFAVFMGAASYSLYLVHPLTAPIAPQIFHKVGFIQPYLSVAASILIASAAGALCHLLVELPLGRRFDRIAKAGGLLDPGPSRNGDGTPPPVGGLEYERVR